MKKVLIIGPEFYGYCLSIKSAFQNLGYEARVITYSGGEVSSFGERTRYHLSKNKDHFWKIKRDKFNEDVLKQYSEFKPDLVFIIQAGEVYLETVEKMNTSKKVLWMMDSIFRNKRGYAIRNSVDEIFVFEKTDIPTLWEQDRIKAHFLPLALDEAVYFPTTKTNDIDILFVGALYENRIKLLENICERFKKYNIRIYGYYYSPFRRPFYHLFRKYRKHFLNKNISPEMVNKLYNRSRICLNIHHAQTQYGVNQRFFEISGSKAFQLVDHNQFIEENFSGDEIITYRSEKDLLEKIESALMGKTDIVSVAENAYNRVLADHTFTHRIGQMLNTIESGKVLSTGTGQSS